MILRSRGTCCPPPPSPPPSSPKPTPPASPIFSPPASQTLLPPRPPGPRIHPTQIFRQIFKNKEETNQKAVITATHHRDRKHAVDVNGWPILAFFARVGSDAPTHSCLRHPNSRPESRARVARTLLSAAFDSDEKVEEVEFPSNHPAPAAKRRQNAAPDVSPVKSG